MKLVIDIPDYDREQIKKYYEESEILESVYSYIYHGQPLSEILDKISADIKSMEYHMIDCDVLVSQEEVLDIIDKYKEVRE